MGELEALIHPIDEQCLERRQPGEDGQGPPARRLAIVLLEYLRLQIRGKCHGLEKLGPKLPTEKPPPGDHGNRNR